MDSDVPVVRPAAGRAREGAGLRRSPGLGFGRSPAPWRPKGRRRRHRRPLREFGSPGRTRTCNLVVTRAPAFPRGSDYLIPVGGPQVAGRGRALPPIPSPRRCAIGVRPLGL